jgi:predicted permease
VALAAGVVATIGSGWWPAWFGTRGLSIESLKGSSNSASFGTRTTRALTRSLVIAETAMACALLSGAVLVVRSFINLSNVERGLQTDGVVTASIQLPTAAFADPTARTAMTSLIEDTMRRLPGVQQVAFSFGLPPAGGTIQHGSNWRSSVTGAAPLDLEVESYDVGADFFDLYRIPIVRGRGIRSADTMRDVVIGERLAQLLWPNADPIGGSFTFAKEAYQVVGVAREINHPSVVASNDRPEYYRPIQADARARNYFMLSLRCDTRCPDGASIRYQLLQLNPAIVVVNVGPLDDAYFRQLAAPRAAAALAIVFAMVGVIAAAGGLFGVLSYTVGRRRRELGVRAAIGASRRDIRQLVSRDGLVTGVAGIAIGAAGSWWLARGLSAIQYGVSAGDPVSWLLVTLLLALTVFAAVWQPAVRAARVDPAQLLRQD